MRNPKLGQTTNAPPVTPGRATLLCSIAALLGLVAGCAAQAGQANSADLGNEAAPVLAADDVGVPAEPTLVVDNPTRPEEDETEREGLEIRSFVERELFVSLDDLVAETDLVARGVIGDLELLSGGNTATWVQEFSILEVLLGDDPPDNLKVLSTGSIHLNHPDVSDALASDGKFYLPPEGFGGLSPGHEYVVFLTYPNTELGHGDSAMWVEAQGVYLVDGEQVLPNRMGPDSTERVLAQRLQDGRSVGTPTFEFEEVPVLVRGGSLSDLRSELDVVRASFSPAGEPSDRLNTRLELGGGNSFDANGELIGVTILDGAANGAVFVAMCRSNPNSVDECDVANAVLVELGSDGFGSAELFVHGEPFADEAISCAEVDCAIVAGSLSTVFVSVPIEPRSQ